MTDAEGSSVQEDESAADEPVASGESETAKEPELESAFAQTVDEGVRRLDRSLPALFATGFVGGVDVSIGVFALLVVIHLTDSVALGALAFSSGFIALTLAKSELFTENFLVPLVAMLARPEEGLRKLARLWAGTAVMNLVGGWIVSAIVVSGFPDLRTIAVRLGQHFVEIGIGWRSFAMAMMAGAIITVMTWMIEGTESQGPKMVAAVVAGFLLAAGEVNHCIVASLEMFAGLIAGAPYGYLDWLTVFAWSALGNLVGGVGLVTVLRVVQVGREPVRRRQRELDEREG